MLTKVKLEELQMALDHLKKSSSDLTVRIGLDDSNNRLLIVANDKYNKEIKITVFNADVNMFPEVTHTEWLRKEKV